MPFPNCIDFIDLSFVQSQYVHETIVMWQIDIFELCFGFSELDCAINFCLC